MAKRLFSPTGRLLPFLGWAAMGLLAFCLPFTSFPLVAELTGSSMVAPLALLPLAALLLGWFVPHLARRGALPPQAKVALAFFVVALIACILAFVLPIPAYKHHRVLNREIEALATLAIGIGFYLLFAAWVNHVERLRFVLRWVNWGGLLMLLWSFAQGYAWYTMLGYPDWMWSLQERLSTSLVLFQGRANGVAYEPSWHAHQLNMLYLPYWLAATVSGFTAHRFRLWKVSLENLLLLGGLGALVLSISRVGWLAFLLMASYLVLYFTWRFVQWSRAAILRRYQRGGQWGAAAQNGVAAVIVLLIAAVYLGVMFGAAYFLSRHDPRMANLFDFSALREGSLLAYANQLVFAERIVFWQAGWEVFNDYPLLGVGLGNAGFFFPEKLTAFSWGLTETRLIAYHWTSLPNIKSLWVRLLAETGIAGFGVFVSFWYVLWKSGHYLLAQHERLFRAAGMAGALVLVGLLIEGFSVDTFALPYFWVSFGLLSASCELVRRGCGRLSTDF